MEILKTIGSFFVKLFVAIGMFFKNLGLGIYHGIIKFGKGIYNWFRNFGKRFKDSSTTTKVGHFVMGVGSIGHKQYTRGIIYLLIEILFFVFMIASPKASGTNLGFKAIGNFFTLGSAETMDVESGVKSFSNDYNEVIKYASGLVDENGDARKDTEGILASVVRTNAVLNKVMDSPAKYIKASDGKYTTDEMIVDTDYNEEKPDYYSYVEYAKGTKDLGSISLPYIAWIESSSAINFALDDFEVKSTQGGEEATYKLSENGTAGVYERKEKNNNLYSYFIVISGVSGRNVKLSITDEAAAKYENAEIYSIGFNTKYVNTEVDNSFLMMLFGVFSFAILVLFLLVYFNSIKSAYNADLEEREGITPQNFKQDLKDLLGDKFHLTLLLPAIVFMIIFTIIPTIFMILISFTDFQQNAQMSGSKLINWVGLQNFISLFAGDASNSISKEVGMNFGSVLLWTFIWAIIATFSCYFGGILLALLLNKKEIKAKKFWRTIFILTIAIPQFISLLIMRNLLKQSGPVNSLFGLNIDWLAQSSEYAGGNVSTGVIWRVRITILVVNLWLGIPYTMLMTSGILMNIPADLYEAATIDGANKFQMFRKITLPYVIFVTTPYLISSFIGNITAFNTIYLLTGGGPSKGSGIIAGETDLLVTWLYKLTIDNQLYNAGSVIGILTFIITALLTLIFYRNSKAYKEEDTFQ